MKNRLSEILAPRGMKKRVADALEMSQGHLSDIVSGKRRLNEDHIEKISSELNIEPWEIFLDPLRLTPVNEKIHQVPVIGRVKAGAFDEALQWDDSEIYNIEYCGTLPKNSFALKVQGDSMDKFYPNNSVVICAPTSHVPIENQDHVIVQRTDRSGRVEATIKELVIINGKAELWPRSNNPKYQNPISITWPYDNGEEVGLEKVEIIGIVLSMQMQRKRI